MATSRPPPYRATAGNPRERHAGISLITMRRISPYLRELAVPALGIIAVLFFALLVR